MTQNELDFGIKGAKMPIRTPRLFHICWTMVWEMGKKNKEINLNQSKKFLKNENKYR